MSTPTDIIFFGTSAFAIPALDALFKSGLKPTVITTPDKPAGRKLESTPSPIKLEASELGLQIFQPEDLKEDTFFKTFISIKPQICVVVAYGKIIPKKYLDTVSSGFINVHPSLLPKYRGPAPIQYALMNGEVQTGVTLIKLDAEVDHGPILTNVKYQITNDEYYPELEKKLSELGAKLLIETLPEYLAEKIIPTPQNHDRASYTARLTRTDGKINWSNTAEEIYNRIRGLNPEPGTWTTWQGKDLLILKAKPLPFCVISTGHVGQVARIKSTIAVKTGSCPIELHEVQLTGSRPMPISDFINGHPTFLKSQLGMV